MGFSFSRLNYRAKHAFRLFKLSGGRYFRHAAIVPPYAFCLNGKTFLIQSEDSEASRSCYCEVIIDDVYGLFKWKPQKTNPLIVDIGSNIGTFSVLAKSLFPESQVEAFEPHPLVLPWLKKNAEAHNFTVNSVGVAASAYKAKLDSSTASTCAAINSKEGYDIEVVGPESVAPGQTIDMLKLDCEGAEHEILQDGSLLKRTQSLRMEFHADTLEKNQKLFDKIKESGLTITLNNPFKLAHGLLGILHADRLN